MNLKEKQKIIDHQRSIIDKKFKRWSYTIKTNWRNLALLAKYKICVGKNIHRLCINTTLNPIDRKIMNDTITPYYEP